jgi:hypothetical protein
VAAVLAAAAATGVAVLLLLLASCRLLQLLVQFSSYCAGIMLRFSCDVMF